MAVSRYPMFSREGWPLLSAVVVAAVATWHFAGFPWSIPFWLLCLPILYVYRDPEREIPSSPLAVVSPSDGRVTAIEMVDDPYLDRRALRVQIEMYRSGTFGTRSPVEGKVLEPRRNGNGLPDGAPQGVWLKTDEDDDLVVVMGRGPLHNVPRCFVRFGERVGQGQRCGHIHFGGRIEVYLPENSRVTANIGDRLQAGSDVIANLVHK